MDISSVVTIELSHIMENTLTSEMVFKETSKEVECTFRKKPDPEAFYVVPATSAK